MPSNAPHEYYSTWDSVRRWADPYTMQAGSEEYNDRLRFNESMDAYNAPMQDVNVVGFDPTAESNRYMQAALAGIREQVGSMESARNASNNSRGMFNSGVGNGALNRAIVDKTSQVVGQHAMDLARMRQGQSQYETEARFRNRDFQENRFRNSAIMRQNQLQSQMNRFDSRLDMSAGMRMNAAAQTYADRNAAADRKASLQGSWLNALGSIGSAAAMYFFGNRNRGPNSGGNPYPGPAVGGPRLPGGNYG